MILSSSSLVKGSDMEIVDVERTPREQRDHMQLALRVEMARAFDKESDGVVAIISKGEVLAEHLILAGKAIHSLGLYQYLELVSEISTAFSDKVHDLMEELPVQTNR